MASATARYTDADQWYEAALEHGWSDGLPLHPPTTAAVEAGVTALGRDRDEVLGILPPMRGLATVEQVVVNSIMAGCTPSMLPVVLAALDAMLDPSFELAAAQVTTNGCAPLAILGGPVVHTLGLNSAEAAFAGGSRANAAIGRALRLILRNIAGAIPGQTSKVTHAHPGWYSYCIAERAEANPWPPLHASRGYPPGSSCVTVFFCQAPFPLYLPGSPDRMLRVLGTSMATPGVNMYFGGGQVLLVLAPRVARALAAAGLDREGVARQVWRHAHYRLGDLRERGIFDTEGHTFYWGARNPAPQLAGLDDDTALPMVDSPQEIHILVSGGDGQFWAGFCPGWGEFGGLAVTRPITLVS